MFDRDSYYSKTDVVKKFKISSKKFDALVSEKALKEVNNDIVYFDYTITTRYILKSDIDSLNLQLRTT